jgi:hypothetical protein
MLRRGSSAIAGAACAIAFAIACGDSYSSGEIASEDGGAGDGGGAPKIVFVSSTKSSAALGGVAGADMRCRALAADAGLAGSFVALLGTTNVSPGTRLAGGGPWARPDGKLVASSMQDLFDGTLAAPISVDERKGSAPDDVVWTNVFADGGTRGHGCSEFRSSSDEIGGAGTGSTARVDQGWLDGAGESVCYAQRRIYCFQE